MIRLTPHDVRSVVRHNGTTGEARFDAVKNRIMAISSDAGFDALIRALTELRDHVASGGKTSGEI